MEVMSCDIEIEVPSHYMTKRSRRLHMYQDKKINKKWEEDQNKMKKISGRLCPFDYEYFHFKEEDYFYHFIHFYQGNERAY